MSKVIILAIFSLIVVGFIGYRVFTYIRAKQAKKQADLRILTDLKTRVNILESEFRLRKINEDEYNRGLAEVVELLDKFENSRA